VAVGFVVLSGFNLADSPLDQRKNLTFFSRTVSDRFVAQSVRFEYVGTTQRVGQRPHYKTTIGTNFRLRILVGAVPEALIVSTVKLKSSERLPKSFRKTAKDAVRECLKRGEAQESLKPIVANLVKWEYLSDAVFFRFQSELISCVEAKVRPPDGFRYFVDFDREARRSIRREGPFSRIQP